MHFLRSQKFKHAVAFGIGSAIGVLYLLSAIAANADTIAGVSVAGNGQTVVRGARVLQVTKSDVTAVSEWGVAKIIWKIHISGSTRFSPQRDDQTLSQMLHVGEKIGFTGTMDHNAGAPTIHASMIRNETVVQKAAVLSGSVVGPDKSGLIVQTETGTSTILIGTGTIMTKDGNKAGIADMRPGENIKAFGTFNAHSRTLDAQRIVSWSSDLPGIPNTGTLAKSGMFETIVAWLSLRGGALSAR